MKYRNKKLRESARYESCVACGTNDGTTVFAHSNSQRHGKGMGEKAHDLFGAYLCVRCHREFDEGNKSREEKQSNFLRWWEETMIIACDRGYLL
jgi:transposase-like protein